MQQRPTNQKKDEKTNLGKKSLELTKEWRNFISITSHCFFLHVVARGYVQREFTPSALRWIRAERWPSSAYSIAKLWILSGGLECCFSSLQSQCKSPLRSTGHQHPRGADYVRSYGRLRTRSVCLRRDESVRNLDTEERPYGECIQHSLPIRVYAIGPRPIIDELSLCMIHDGWSDRARCAVLRLWITVLCWDRLLSQGLVCMWSVPQAAPLPSRLLEL